MTATTKSVSRNTNRILGSRSLLLPGLLICVILLVLCLLWSITLGAADIAPGTVFAAIFAPERLVPAFDYSDGAPTARTLWRDCRGSAGGCRSDYAGIDAQPAGRFGHPRH